MKDKQYMMGFYEWDNQSFLSGLLQRNWVFFVVPLDIDLAVKMLIDH